MNKRQANILIEISVDELNSLEKGYKEGKIDLDSFYKEVINLKEYIEGQIKLTTIYNKM